MKIVFIRVIRPSRCFYRMRRETELALINLIRERINKLDANTVFSTDQLFTPDEWFAFTTQKVEFIKHELQFRTRFAEKNYYWFPEDVTEISNHLYIKTKPKVPPVESFNGDTSVQILFLYIKKIIKKNITCNDRFLLSDLFPGYIWSKFSLNQKISLGYLVERYDWITRKYIAMVDRTKQGQAVYCGLYNPKTKSFDNWEEKTMMSVTKYYASSREKETTIMSYKQINESGYDYHDDVRRVNHMKGN